GISTALSLGDRYMRAALTCFFRPYLEKQARTNAEKFLYRLFPIAVLARTALSLPRWTMAGRSLNVYCPSRDLHRCRQSRLHQSLVGTGCADSNAELVPRQYSPTRQDAKR